MKGLVIKSTGSWYRVKLEDNRIIPCRIRGKFRTSGMEITNPVAVGDHVEVIPAENEPSGLITRIYERKNYIIRKSPNLSHKAQILAANIDQAILIITLKQPVTTTVFVDRFLASAEAYRIPTHLLFNKTDLYNKEEKKELGNWLSLYRSLDYHCLTSSIPRKEGLDEFKELLQNLFTLIAGHSGVGKSSLLNIIDPDLKLKTGEISNYHQSGKHTTTFPEMFAIKNGGYVIDTPGIKGFGMVDMDKEEIFHFFREIFRFSENCRYHNCLHMGEPGCAVKEAVKKGHIAYSRYLSYINMMEENEGEKYRS